MSARPRSRVMLAVAVGVPVGHRTAGPAGDHERPVDGREVTVAEIEAYKGDFAGAMPSWGTRGNNLFGYYLGDSVTAAAFTGTTPSPVRRASGGVGRSPRRRAGRGRVGCVRMPSLVKTLRRWY
jgi:hypothetical protein